MKAQHSTSALVAALLSALPLAACEGNLDAPERFRTGRGGEGASSLSCPDVAAYFASSACAGCHGASAPSGGLDLVSPGIASRTVGVSAVSGGFLLVAGDPDRSVLYRRLAGGDVGPTMPPGAPIDAAMLACARSFIAGLGAASAPASTPPPSLGDASAAPTPLDAGPTAPTTAPQANGTTVRIAAGSSAAITDGDGITWAADTMGVGGTGTTFAPPHTITNTKIPAIYGSERYGGDAAGNTVSFRYSLPVAQGSYKVALHFSENYFTGAGERRFHVDVAGKRVLTDFDIFAESGGKDIAVVKTFTASADGSPLVIELSPGSSEKPKLSAIEIVPQ